MKKISTYLVYISIPFLLFFLYKLDYLSLSGIQIQFKYLIIACVFSIVGFYLSAINWRTVLKLGKISISLPLAVISHGLPIFSKYIPGKMWVILGRSGIVSKRLLVNQVKVTYFSLQEQLVFIWLGLLISLHLAVHLLDSSYWILYALFLIVLTLFLFTKRIHDIALSFLNKFLKRKIEVPFIELKKTPVLIAGCCSYWLSWMIGFYFLVKAFSFPNLTVDVAIVFPFSSVLGLIAVFAPGGIGIREGLMTLALLQFGITKEYAIPIAVMARIWFLLGEIFIFLYAIILNYRNKLSST